MKVILHRTTQAPWQQFPCEWFGARMEPPCEFRFRLTENELIYAARRAAPALLHPESREGEFQEELWKYDTTEFYLTDPESGRYMEFNLAPNGAWWSAVFTAPRVVAPCSPAAPAGVTARGHVDTAGWECEVRIPLSALADMGFTPTNTPCRMAAAAILNSPGQLFLTTATDTSGRPDFHRPWGWEEAERPEA